MIYGLDILGAAQFDRKTLRALPKDFALGFLEEFFGSVMNVMEKRAATGNFPRIRYHAKWEPNHKYIPAKHDDIILERFAAFIGVANRYPGIDWQFSPFLEAEGDLRPILKEIKREFGPLTVRLVNSVYKAPLCKPELAINEVHGDMQPAGSLYNYSSDGESSVDQDIISLKELHRTCDTFYFWHASFNGKLNDQDSTPANERRAWPTPDLIRSVAYLANRARAATLPTNWIWKSHADRHNTPPESRAYKPVLIATVKQAKMVLRGISGRVIGTMPYGGLYQDGVRHLYRLDDYGYRLAEKNDNRLVTIEGYGKVNPAFRAGSFR